MFLDFFITGAIISFSIAAPIGHIGIICMKRTLNFGKLSGFISGLGAATAHVIFASILLSGLTLISDCLLKARFWLSLIAGTFLIYLGIKTFFAKLATMPKKVTKKTLLKDYASILILTLTNPMTIIPYLAAFTSFGLEDLEKCYINSILIVLGIFTGATTWWFLLSEITAKFKKKINDRFMLWVNRIAGLMIFSFGVLAWFFAFFR